MTTDYLLGRPVPSMSPKLEYTPVSPDALPTLHGFPIWDERCSWGLVNSMERQVHFLGGHTIPFSDAVNLSALPRPLMIGYYLTARPLTLDELLRTDTPVWVVPIGVSAEIQHELQGWYKRYGPYMENEFRQRFYLDNYGVKWLASNAEHFRIP